MGGNAAAIDRTTGEVINFDGRPAYADKINLKKVDRSAFKRDMIAAFLSLNSLYEKKFDEPIWDKDVLPELMSGDAFNGSSEHLFGSMSDEEFLKHKAMVGDIDLTVPRDKLSSIFELLSGLEGKTISPRISYVGQNKFDQYGHQINSLFAYAVPEFKKRALVQVDFEGVDYDASGKPDEFAKFSHSSAWEDIQEGIKGVAHKYLLRSLAKSISFRKDVVLLTDKSPLSPPEKIKIAKSSLEGTHLLAFSVDLGVRSNAEQQFLPDGSPLMVGDKFAFKSLPTEKSSYVKTRKGVFQALFKLDPSNEELKMLNSFVGCLQLLKKYADESIINATYLDLLKDKLFGKGSQRLDASDPEVDRSVKMTLIARMKKEFPQLEKFDNELEKLSGEYYSSYKTREMVESMIRQYVKEFL
jgi:hypothetical protein